MLVHEASNGIQVSQDHRKFVRVLRVPQQLHGSGGCNIYQGPHADAQRTDTLTAPQSAVAAHDDNLQPVLGSNGPPVPCVP
jgi:hypothetical protein